MKKNIELKTTHKGLVGSYVNSIVWISILCAARWVLRYFLDGVYAKYELASMGDMWGCVPSKGVRAFIFFGNIACWICVGVAILFLVFGILKHFFYTSKTINILSDASEGRGGQSRQVTYGFPFSKRISDDDCDEVRGVRVIQGSVDRLFNTGSLRLKTNILVNGDHEEISWTVPAINNPEERKEEIEKMFPAHKGVLVKLDE